MLLNGHANVDVGPPTAPPGRSRGHRTTMTDLSRFPRIPLATLPTPLEGMDRLSSSLAGDDGPGLWVKRDDLTGLGLGGNKVRKLEFLLGAARAEGADTVVTFGALQSNHARQTAAACARVGLACELILTRAVPITGDAYERSGNVMLDHLFGATCTIVDNDDDLMAVAMGAVEERVAARGGRAFWVRPGGSDAVGSLGYVAAGLELAGQARDLGLGITDVVVAVSTGGTYAGLLTGLRLGGCDARVHGIDVYKPAEHTAGTVELLAAEVAELVGVGRVDPAEITLTDDFLGPGYGIPTPEMVEALGLVARTEGVVLDPVYSGKAMAALVSMVRSGAFGAQDRVVFLHTGGSPGLFAYADELADPAAT